MYIHSIWVFVNHITKIETYKFCIEHQPQNEYKVHFVTRCLETLLFAFFLFCWPKKLKDKKVSCCVFCDFARFCNLQGCYHVFYLWTCHIGIVCSSFGFNLNNNVSYISCSNKLNMYELLLSLFFYISRLIQLNIMKKYYLLFGRSTNWT